MFFLIERQRTPVARGANLKLLLPWAKWLTLAARFSLMFCIEHHWFLRPRFFVPPQQQPRVAFGDAIIPLWTVIRGIREFASRPDASPFLFRSRYAEIRFFCPASVPLDVASAPPLLSLSLGENTDGLVASLFFDGIPFDAVKRIPCEGDVISHIYRITYYDGTSRLESARIGRTSPKVVVTWNVLVRNSLRLGPRIDWDIIRRLRGYGRENRPFSRVEIFAIKVDT